MKGLGDYVKIDYLASCLRNNIDFDTRKFVLTELSALYESKGMFVEAGKLMRNSADINTTFIGKISDFMKSAELFSKAGNFEEADISISKALASANTKEKSGIKLKQKLMYMAQAELLLRKDKRKQAMGAYEKLLSFDLTQTEKLNVQNTLLGLYEKLGKIREYMNLKRNL